MSKLVTTIVRNIRRDVDNKPVTIQTKTTKNEYFSGSILNIAYYNCIYIIFIKEDFPDLTYPKLEENKWMKGQRFDYNACSLAALDWHGGITFYKEEKDMETGEILVTAGADYQHHGDEIYMSTDSGEGILKVEASNLYNQFIELTS